MHPGTQVIYTNKHSQIKHNGNLRAVIIHMGGSFDHNHNDDINILAISIVFIIVIIIIFVIIIIIIIIITIIIIIIIIVMWSYFFWLKNSSASCVLHALKFSWWDSQVAHSLNGCSNHSGLWWMRVCPARGFLCQELSNPSDVMEKIVCVFAGPDDLHIHFYITVKNHTRVSHRYNRCYLILNHMDEWYVHTFELLFTSYNQEFLPSCCRSPLTCLELPSSLVFCHTIIDSSDWSVSQSDSWKVLV